MEYPPDFKFSVTFIALFVGRHGIYRSFVSRLDKTVKYFEFAFNLSVPRKENCLIYISICFIHRKYDNFYWYLPFTFSCILQMSYTGWYKNTLKIKIPLTKMYIELDVICLLIFLVSSFPHVCQSDCTLFAMLLSIAFSSVQEYNPLSLYNTSCMDNWLHDGFVSSLFPLHLDMLYLPIL